MMKTNHLYNLNPSLVFRALLLGAFLTQFTACGSSNVKRSTLGDIDSSPDVIVNESNQKVTGKSAEEVRAAYYQYLQNAKANDASRQLAITRLAQMELELTNTLISQSSAAELEEDALYNETLLRTIELLETSLSDFPNAKGNDSLLYQLARTYDQIGEYDKTLTALEQLVSQYQKSVHYAEAQFRLGEAAFINGDYLTAENAYTETIISNNADNFYEKAFFKRGWTRYKQELYIEAVDDFIESLTFNRSANIDALNENEKSLFNEYFRAIGLSFSHLDGAESLRNYFDGDSNFRYLYHIYATISEIYLNQQRYADSVETLNQFVTHHSDLEEVPKAKINIIKIWQKSGFASNVHSAIEDFYTLYNPNAEYWKKSGNTKFKKVSIEALKQYIADEASYFHSRYQDKKLIKEKTKNFQNASVWYKRYLNDFPDVGRKEGIYHQYGELLYSEKHYEDALQLFEIAAYDEDIILDKRSAYMTINLSDILYSQAGINEQQKNIRLNRLIKYTQRYIGLYPDDIDSSKFGLHAAQLAFSNKRFDDALQLALATPKGATVELEYQLDIITARAYFEKEEFADAENSYLSMLSKNTLKKYKKDIEDSLALAIYRQAEKAKSLNNIAEAIHHFTRVTEIVPYSKVSSSSLYDGITLAMANQQWLDVITYGQRFSSLYPKSKFNNDVTKNLSVAYLNSNQGDKAAREFERISSFEKDENVKMAALWQAAELYEKKGDIEGAIRSYRNFAHQYKQAHAQNIEAMFKLTALYNKRKNAQKREFWLNKIAEAGRKSSESQNTDRTIYVAASATIELATIQHARFNKQVLKAPLKANLRKKKSLMQVAIELYGNASSYGLADITTQSTFGIGSIYQEFSIALLESERPSSLTADELDQYEILLEDQAFPFEDKAIEFHETNIARSKTGLYNEWMAKSRTSLAELFPVRYSRQPKILGHITND